MTHSAVFTAQTAACRVFLLALREGRAACLRAAPLQRETIRQVADEGTRCEGGGRQAGGGGGGGGVVVGLSGEVGKWVRLQLF